MKSILNKKIRNSKRIVTNKINYLIEKSIKPYLIKSKSPSKEVNNDMTNYKNR